MASRMFLKPSAPCRLPKGRPGENYLAHYPWSLPSSSLLPGGAGNVGDLVLQSIHSTGNWRWRMCPLYSSLLLPDPSFLPKSPGLGTWAISLQPPKTTQLHFFKFSSRPFLTVSSTSLGNVFVVAH